MAETSIEWTQATWNPVRGCTKISPGCKFCYAEVMAQRLKAMGQPQYVDGFALRLAPEMLDVPRKWKKPKTIFVNSMSDLFHEDVPVEYIQRVFAVMNDTLRHTYQILTKRAERLADLSSQFTWGPNIWMGVSVENQRHGLPRIEGLRKVSVAIRFLSIEPLLEHLGPVSFDGIHWVIVGGESGHGARPIEKAWVEDIRRQCDAQSVPFFFKQWGGPSGSGKKFNPDPTDPTLVKGHPSYAKGGCQLDGRVYREMPRRISLPMV